MSANNRRINHQPFDGARATFSVRLAEAEFPRDIVASSNAALLMDLAAEPDAKNRDLFPS
jgi:hypothetical protein